MPNQEEFEVTQNRFFGGLGGLTLLGIILGPVGIIPGAIIGAIAGEKYFSKLDRLEKEKKERLSNKLKYIKAVRLEILDWYFTDKYIIPYKVYEFVNNSDSKFIFDVYKYMSKLVGNKSELEFMLNNAIDLVFDQYPEAVARSDELLKELFPDIFSQTQKLRECIWGIDETQKKMEIIFLTLQNAINEKGIQSA